MKVNKEENRTELLLESWATNNPVSLITFMVDLYGTLAFPRDRRLTKKETMVLVAMILSYSEGHTKYLSTRFRSVMTDLTGLTSSSEVTKYINFVNDKGWLTSFDKSSKEFEILEFFKGIKLDSYEFDAKIVAKYATNGQNN